MSQRQFDNLQLIARTAFIRTSQIIFVFAGRETNLLLIIQHELVFRDEFLLFLLLIFFIVIFFFLACSKQKFQTSLI